MAGIFDGVRVVELAQWVMVPAAGAVHRRRVPCPHTRGHGFGFRGPHADRPG